MYYEKHKDTFVAAKKDEENLKKKKELTTEKQIAECTKYFATLSQEQQEQILNDIKRNPFLTYLPNQESRILLIWLLVSYGNQKHLKAKITL